MYRIVLNETSYYGAGCRSVIADEIKKRGYKKAMLITDKDLVKFGVAAKVEEVLKGADIPYEVFSDIKPNPTIKNVLDALAAFQASGAECIVALGGGSSIDTAKAVGARGGTVIRSHILRSENRCSVVGGCCSDEESCRAYVCAADDGRYGCRGDD